MEAKQTEYLAVWFDGKVTQMGLTVKTTKEDVLQLIKKSGVIGGVVITEAEDVIHRCDTCRQCWRRMATMHSQN